MFLLFIPLNSIAGEDNLKYTLNREDFENAALIRISELFSLIGEWDVYSVEGYTWQGTANAFDSYQQQNWTIIVDGQKMALKMFDLQNLNLIPLSADHIDSIEIFIFPQLVDTEYSDKGLIHIHTRKMPDGLNLHGQFTAGNKTGDPGPYRYTEYWSRNVDRIAADHSYGLAYSGNRGYLSGGYYTQVYYPTDSRIADRNRDIYPYENPRIITNSFFVQTAAPQIISQPQMSILHTKLEDFYFFKPFGREIPVTNNFTSIQINGKIVLKRSFDIGYKLRLTSNNLAKRKNRYNLDFDWKQQNIYANIDTRFVLNQQKINLGLAVDRTKIETRYNLTTNIINSIILYGSTAFKSDVWHGFKLNGAIDIDKEDIGYQLSGSAKWHLSEQQNLLNILSYSRTKVRSENSLWYWSEKGYDFVKDYGLGYSIDGKLKAGEQWSIDLIWQWYSTDITSINAGISYRSFINKNLELQPFQYNADDKTVASPVYIKTGQAGQGGLAFFKFRSDFFNSLSHSFYYRYSTYLDGSDVFTDIWESISKHRFMYQLIFKPVNTFSIWVMFNYRSSVFWSDYAAINNQSDGTYSAKLSDVFITDIAVNKWFWQKQIKVNFVLRNIFDQKDISYPIGSLQNLRFYAQAELFFNF